MRKVAILAAVLGIALVFVATASVLVAFAYEGEEVVGTDPVEEMPVNPDESQGVAHTVDALLAQHLQEAGMPSFFNPSLPVLSTCAGLDLWSF